MIPHGSLMIATHQMLMTDQKLIPLFFWPAQRPKCFKNCVTKNPELFHDTPNLAEDFDSPICPICTFVKIFNDYYYFKIVSMRSRAHNKDIASDKGHFEVFPKEKENSSLCHAFLQSYFFCFGHDLLHFAMLLLTKFAPKTKIFSSTIDSPCFGAKSEIYCSPITIHCYYSLSLFIRYCL